MKRFLVLLSFFLLVFELNASASNGNITGEVFINTIDNKVVVSLNYDVFFRPSDSISFYLSSRCTIFQLSGERVSGYHSDTLSKPARKITIYLDNGPAGNKNFKLRLIYEFLLDASHHKNGFIELGLDWFWFPVHPTFNEWKFNFDLDVKISDDSYDLFSNGQVRRYSSDHYNIRSRVPDFDIDLFLFADAEIIQKGNKVKVAGDKNNPQLKDSIATTAAGYIDFYNTLFETRITRVTCIFRPLHPDVNSFGYARYGYFVLQEPKRLNDIKLFLAHELAHMWFLNGEPSENSWLTESLAEFIAMVVIRKTEGESFFQAILKDKRDRLHRLKTDGKVIPPVYKNGSKGKSMLSQVALYHKGPLLLWDLQQRIGEAKMLKLLKEVVDKKTSTSEEFLEKLEGLTDTTTATYFFDLLRS